MTLDLAPASVNVIQKADGLYLVKYSVGHYRAEIECCGYELPIVIAEGMAKIDNFNRDLTLAQQARQKARDRKNWDNVAYGVDTREGLGHGAALATRCFPNGARQMSRKDREPKVGDLHTVSGLSLL